MKFLKSKVLIVDDSSMQRLAWVMEFTRCSQIVPVTARHGKEALEIAKVSPPDLLVTDLDMPVMNGAELIREIKALYPTLVTIVVSSNIEPGFRKAMSVYSNLFLFSKADRSVAMQASFAHLGLSCVSQKTCSNHDCPFSLSKESAPVTAAQAAPAALRT